MTVPILAVVELPDASGIVADRVDMDFAFNAADAAEATLDGIAASLVSFFDTTSTQSKKIGQWMAASLSRAANAARVSFYNLTGALDGSPHGSPVQVVDWTMPAITENTSLPAEVACKISVHGDLTGIVEKEVNPAPPPAFFRPAQRRRGGFFLGPLANGAKTAGSGEPTRPIAAFKTDLRIAILRFTDERADWGVWSRADETIYPVLPDGGVYVDDAFDTIRKRGPEATSRTVLFP